MMGDSDCLRETATCLVYTFEGSQQGMANSTTQRRRRGPSIEVVNAKVAVDLATAQTYSENVFLFVPNLIGGCRNLSWGVRF